jgi:putative restriction endonuclease
VRFWVANTDRRWFEFLAGIPSLSEANFWQPNRVRPVSLEQGAPWLFKLHVREGGWIVGGGYFVHYTTLTPWLAWDAFGQSMGAATYEDFLRGLRRYSVHPIDPLATEIGSSVLVEPFFLPRQGWIAPPTDWSSNLTRGKSYDTEAGEGRRLWDAVRRALTDFSATAATKAISEVKGGYGHAVPIAPRLGQGAFRVMVTDAYARRCVVTGERTRPVLQAAHIKPYSQVGRHEISNGLLLRSDLHTLLDLGYLTVDPDETRLVVSRRIHDEFENGRDYYALEGRQLRAPLPGYPGPASDMLTWHAEHVFRG